MQSRPIYLVRHGETDSNRVGRYAGRNGDPLNETGRRQMESLATALNDLELRCIRASRVKRALQSARILGERLGLPVSSDPRLDEMLMGPWDGLTEKEAARHSPEGYALWQAEPHRLRLNGRETLAEVAARANAAVRDAAESGGGVLLVTHVVVIRVAALSTLGRTLGLYKRVSIPNAGCLRLDLEAGNVYRFPTGECLASELKELGVPAA